MIPKVYFSSITKDRLLAFLGKDDNKKLKKHDLINEITTLLRDNEILYKKFFNTFKKELAVFPTELEKILSCTTTERKRWTEEGKLSVVEYREFKKYNKVLSHPVYNRWEIQFLSPHTIERWREEHQKLVSDSRKTAAKKAVCTKIKHNNLRKGFAQDWKEILISWYHKGSPELAVTIELAYWTVWISRWAKENNLKSRRALKHTNEYKKREQICYELKNKAVKLLSKTPFAKLSFYRPERPDKIYISFCDKHFEDFKDFRDIFRVNKIEYYDNNKKFIHKCNKCIVDINKNYYSLYYLEVWSDILPDIKFSFHTPYPLGNEFWPPPRSLPAVEHHENDGIFRFGRSVLDEEKIVYREKDVLKKFNDSMIKFLLYFQG